MNMLVSFEAWGEELVVVEQVYQLGPGTQP